MYTKYLIVKKQNEVTNFIPPYFNLITLFVGVLGCIGMGIVASFQVGTIMCFDYIYSLKLYLFSGITQSSLQIIKNNI